MDLVVVFLLTFVFAVIIGWYRERAMRRIYNIESCLIEFDFEGSGHFAVILDDEKGLSIYVDGVLVAEYRGEADARLHFDSFEHGVTGFGRLAIWKRMYKINEEIKPVIESKPIE